MSRNATFAAALVAGLFASGAAMAVDAAGVVDVYHVNIQVGGGRSGCIQFAGAGLPNGWGCVYGGPTGLAEAINALLREAALLPVNNPSKRCRVFWDNTDSAGFARIYAAECGPRH
jgi:hypothetical protein